MTTSHSSDGCTPLMEACTLELYNQNIFRITGLPVDATPKQIARQAQKLQMLEEMGGGASGPEAAFSLPTPPTSEEIRAALARMKDPQRRLVDEFFWFWPEADSTGSTDPAILAVAAGDADEAVRLWWTREQEGSESAKHNLAVMYHMSAVDWTLHQFSYQIDHEREDKVKAYWKDAFDRWETLVESTGVRDTLKNRVREIDDDALTTGFVRRFLRELPKAFDQVNAHAALKLAELNRMDWARFHVGFMRQTHQGLDDVEQTAELVLAPTKARVEQHLRDFQTKAKKTPSAGADLARQLLARCKPMMGLFDLFHGKEAHQRNDLFDRVVETILQMVIDHQRATNDNRTFSELLTETLSFASSPALRERILKNISIAEGNLKHETLEPFFKRLKGIQESSAGPKQRLEALKKDVIPYLAQVVSVCSDDKEMGAQIYNSVAIVLRNVSIDAHNTHQDMSTAMEAITLALKHVKSAELRDRLLQDSKQLQQHMLLHATASIPRVSQRQSSSGCLVALSIPIAISGAWCLSQILT